MKNITDEDLILLFYGEHEDPALASKVAESEELTSRFDQLSAELKLADSYAAPQRDDDYGSEMWQAIAPQLDIEPSKNKGWLKTLLAGLSRPNVSLAGALSVALVAALAFMLGRSGGNETHVDPFAEVGNSAGITALAVANVDSSQLLSHSVSGHFDQVNLTLTQFANSPVSMTNESTNATDLLVANRLYRQAAMNQGDRQLAALLTELEPLLIEMAYEAQKNSPATRVRMQEEVKNGLLFKVRVMNNQLRKPQTSV